jgi:hypothetical protein
LVGPAVPVSVQPAQQRHRVTAGTAGESHLEN